MTGNIVIVLNRGVRSDNAAKRPCARRKKHLFSLRSVCFSTDTHTQTPAQDADVDSGVVNIVPAPVKPFNILSYKRQKTKTDI